MKKMKYDLIIARYGEIGVKSSKRHSKKFTSLTIPKNFLTKREDRIIQPHSEFVNSERKARRELDLTLAEHKS